MAALPKKMKITRDKSSRTIAVMRPDLLEEWDWEKNNEIGLDPYKLTVGSNKKANWVCSKGHTWDAMIYSRHSGRGCPTCGSRKLLVGYNDLATLEPGIADEWHPTKNGDLKPTDVMPHSHYKVWWLGPCGHEWEARINNRVSHLTGCPTCYKDRQVSFSEKATYFYVSKVFSDAKQNAHIEDGCLGKMELDIWIPSKRIGIEYDGYYWHNKNPSRDSDKDSACKAAGIRLIRIRENLCVDYENCHAEVIKLDAKYGSATIDRGISALLEKIAPDTYIDVDTKRDGQEIVALVKSNRVERSLSETHPDIAAQWHPTMNGNLSPNMFTYGSACKAWWVCPNGHEPYYTDIYTRVCGHGCPRCKADGARTRKMTPKHGNSLAERFPEIAKEWHPTKNGTLTPYDVSYGSRKNVVWWVCPKGHEYRMSPNGRTSGHGCKRCSMDTIAAKLRTPKPGNSLAEAHPDIAAEWHPTLNGTLTPSDVTRGSNRLVWWLCPNDSNHAYPATVGNRTNRRSGCPICNAGRPPISLVPQETLPLDFSA